MAMTKDDIMHCLAEEMSDISEDCYCAGWMMGTEETVPRLAREAVRTNQPQHWGQGEISVEVAARLCRMADELGHWVDFSMDPGVEYVPYIPECDKPKDTPDA